jgi:hypothetical protein
VSPAAKSLFPPDSCARALGFNSVSHLLFTFKYEGRKEKKDNCKIFCCFFLIRFASGRMGLGQGKRCSREDAHHGGTAW